MNNLRLGNSHYPFSVWMAPCTLASWFWASLHFGESSFSSGSSTNMRALIESSLVTPNPLAACVVVLYASLFSRARWVSSFCCPQQFMSATLSGSQAAFNRVLISSLFLISFSLAVKGLSPYTEPCSVAKAYLESVSMFVFLPFDSWRAWIRAYSSAC